MGVLHVFEIVQMVPNLAKHHIHSLLLIFNVRCLLKGHTIKQPAGLMKCVRPFLLTPGIKRLRLNLFRISVAWRFQFLQIDKRYRITDAMEPFFGNVGDFGKQLY